MFSLAARRALVTGGGRGIGAAMAAALAGVGAHVIVASRTADELTATVERIGAAGGSAECRPTDLANEDDLAALCRAAGPVDIVVHAAGVNLRPPLAEVDAHVWETTMAVNVDAGFLLGQHLGPAMAARGWGRIVHVGSQQSFRAFGNSGVYGVSKAAVTGLARSQAEAWSRSGVTVNTIIPGFVRTALTESIFVDDPDRADALAARTMVGRNGTVDDFAGIAVFLCSDEASFVTGQTIAVDGGFSVT